MKSKKSESKSTKRTTSKSASNRRSVVKVAAVEPHSDAGDNPRSRGLSSNAFSTCDPLAWLHEAPDSVEEAASEAVRTATIEHADVVPAPPEPTADTVAIENEDFGLFEAEEPSMSSSKSPEPELGVPTESAIENEDFGFFEQDEPGPVAPQPGTSDSTGSSIGAAHSKQDCAVENEDFGFFEGVGMAADTDSTVINLGTHFTVKTAEEWHSSLLDILNGTAAVVIDARDIDQIDGCALQLLCSLNKSISAQGGELRWIGVSSRFRDAAGCIGVEQLLGLPVQALAA